MQIERRNLAPGRTTFDDSNGNTMRGMAMPYGQLSRILEDRARPYRERFERGALRHSDATVLIYGHDLGSVPMARVGAGTLSFRQTDAGLEFSAELPDGPVATALQRGDLDGSVSVGFVMESDTWQNRTNPSVRTVRAAELVELSIVIQGAYSGSRGDVS